MLVIKQIILLFNYRRIVNDYQNKYETAFNKNGHMKISCFHFACCVDAGNLKTFFSSTGHDGKFPRELTCLRKIDFCQMRPRFEKTKRSKYYSRYF